MNQDLVREMFSLLYRQYNGIGEVSPFKITKLCTDMFLLYDYWILSLSLSQCEVLLFCNTDNILYNKNQAIGVKLLMWSDVCLYIGTTLHCYYGFACVYLGHYVHIRYGKMTLCDDYLLSVNCWSWYPLVVGYGTHTVLSASYQIWQILDRLTLPFYEHFTPFVLAPSMIP
jgi:hypothetical protein